MVPFLWNGVTFHFYGTGLLGTGYSERGYISMERGYSERGWGGFHGTGLHNFLISYGTGLLGMERGYGTGFPMEWGYSEWNGVT